jgi:hypothetical protein
MVFSHKICRWLLPWAALASVVALGLLAATHPLFAIAFAACVIVLVLAVVGWSLSERPGVPAIFSIPAYLVAGNAAAAHALVRVLFGRQDPVWEPTRREATP